MIHNIGDNNEKKEKGKKYGIIGRISNEFAPQCERQDIVDDLWSAGSNFLLVSFYREVSTTVWEFVIQLWQKCNRYIKNGSDYTWETESSHVGSSNM